MRVQVFIYIFCLSCFQVAGQGNSDVIRQIMLDILPTKPATTPIVANVPFMLSNKHIDAFKKQSLTERLLSTTEIDQILNDIQASSNFVWTQNLLEGAQLVSQKSYDSLIALNSINRLYKFSKPTFTTDAKYSLVYEAWECGPLCGGWKLTLYQKIKEHWNSIHTFLYSAE